MSQSILLNADLGEGYPYDADIMPLIDIANIACGGHTGDEYSIRKTLELALSHDKYISAHLSYEDEMNFGRVSVEYSEAAFKDMLDTQFVLLLSVIDALGARVSYIKPHGALYHDLAHSPELSSRFLQVCQQYASAFEEQTLRIIGAPQSALLESARSKNIITLAEAFIDRRYDAAGKLLPRSEANALITDPQQALGQAQNIIQHGLVHDQHGRPVTLKAQTLCLHGDTENALQIARKITAGLRG